MVVTDPTDGLAGEIQTIPQHQPNKIYVIRKHRKGVKKLLWEKKLLLLVDHCKDF